MCLCLCACACAGGFLCEGACRHRVAVVPQKVFRKSLGGEPVEEYARYVKWAPPNDSDVHPEDPHGQGHNHSRRDRT